MRNRRKAVVGVALALGLLLTGCTQQETAPEGSSSPSDALSRQTPVDSSFKAVIEDYLRQATNDFERDALKRALETGRVSEADYQEAVNGMLQCLGGRGFPSIAEPDPQTGVVRYLTEGSTEGDGFEAAFEECSIGTTYLVGSLYDQMATNPDNADFVELIAQCLVRKEVYPAGFTKEEFLAIAQTANTLPADDPFFSPASAACQSNPAAR